MTPSELSSKTLEELIARALEGQLVDAVHVEGDHVVIMAHGTELPSTRARAARLLEMMIHARIRIGAIINGPPFNF